MILLVLFAVGLVARAAAGAFFLGPAYPDSFYYVNVAHALAAGRGFNLDYIWNFVDVGGTIPADDIPVLKEQGVAEVYTPGAPTAEIVDFLETRLAS